MPSIITLPRAPNHHRHRC